MFDIYHIFKPIQEKKYIFIWVVNLDNFKEILKNINIIKKICCKLVLKIFLALQQYYLNTKKLNVQIYILTGEIIYNIKYQSNNNNKLYNYMFIKYKVKVFEYFHYFQVYCIFTLSKNKYTLLKAFFGHFYVIFYFFENLVVFCITTCIF